MTRQDIDVHEPRIRVRAMLALLRVLAGPRGRVRFRWSGAGYVYELIAIREPAEPLDIDADPDAPGADQARSRLWQTFGP